MSAWFFRVVLAGWAVVMAGIAIDNRWLFAVGYALGCSAGWFAYKWVTGDRVSESAQ